MHANTNNYKSKNIDYKIIILLVVIVFIIAYFLLFKDLFKDKNIKKEEQMVENAKNYVLTNNITTNKEIYLDVSKIAVEIEDRCSITSGVIFDGVNYIPNLVCNDYQSTVIESNKKIGDFIKLNGSDVMILPKGMMFYDQGYVSNDVIITDGDVGTEEGVYNIYYKATNSSNFAIRKVIVIDNPMIKSLFPTVTINGDDIVYVLAGNTYNDVGATGMDSVDGNISSKIITNGSVNTNQTGEYKIIYILTNSRGYSSYAVRKVNVIDKNSNLEVDYSLNPTKLTNGDVTIKLTVSSEFNKIIYPDGSEGKELNYVVSDSGKYQFIIYDTYDRPIVKEIEINNIDKTVPVGTCRAIRYYNKTEVSVNISSSRQISSYEYMINGSSVNVSKTNSYVSKIVKPTTVKVIVKDSIGNQNEFVCSLEDKLTREITTDSKGKNCLEGYTCYVQFDWGGRNYPFCSKANNPNSCGGIGSNGCSLTSAANAIAAMGIKSTKGTLHTPWTVYDEVYPINKKTGECGGGCSGWSRIRDAVVNAGLTAPETVQDFNRKNLPSVITNLQKGYPVIIYASGRPYSSGTAHYMTLLAIRDDGYVFLSDSANTSGIQKGTYNGKKYYVDTWISTEDLITGNIEEFLLVGPPGLYKGKLR